MDKVIFRKAQLKDVDQIITLYSHSEMDGDRVLDTESIKELLTKINCYPFYHFYLAFIEGEENAVGIFGLLVMDNIAHHGTPSAIVEGVCVSESFQGQGIGKTMMQKAMEISREEGCYKLVLSSNLKREKAHEFYRGLGFEQHGVSFFVDL